MGKVKRSKKFAEMKRMLNLKDSRLKNTDREKKKRLKKAATNLSIRSLPQTPSSMFFNYNTQLGPPYHILIDTNFVNFSITNKLDVLQSMMDCLCAKCIPYITDCVMAELEKLGRRYRVALRHEINDLIQNTSFDLLSIMPSQYAEVPLCCYLRPAHKCYIVATNDKDLKRRIRKIPGVPIMYIHNHRYSIERMPDAYGAPKI